MKTSPKTQIEFEQKEELLNEIKNINNLNNINFNNNENINNINCNVENVINDLLKKVMKFFALLMKKKIFV